MARGNPLTIVQQARRLTNSVLVGLSGGKDSLAVLQLCHEFGFRISAYFLYVVPDISFEEETLTYCERRFGITIHRLPHWVASRDIRAWTFRNPVFSGRVPELKLLDVENHARDLSGIRWVATGQRKDDSLERRAMLSRCDGIDIKNRRFYPVAEWGKRHVLSYLARNRFPLPADYRMFGESWGGQLGAKYLAAIKEHYPDDYRRIEAYYPYCGAQFKREEIIHARRRDRLSKKEIRQEARRIAGAGGGPVVPTGKQAPDVRDGADGTVGDQGSGVQPKDPGPQRS